MGGESPKPAVTPTGAVFLSHASQDADAARRICDALRAAGIEVWFDQSELRGGDVWDRRIREQIHECRLFVPIISANTESRVEGYFRREWKLAVDRTHDLSERVAFLVPVVIDSTLELKADVPDAFRHVQWTRLPGGETAPAFVERVSRLLTHHQSSAAPVQTLAAPPPNAAVEVESARGPTPSRWLLLAVALIAAAVLISYIIIDRLWLPKRSSAAQTSVADTGSGAQSRIPEKSIAVLPFADLSESHDQQYFADGLAEEILSLLAKTPGLHVVGRTSSFQFRSQAEDLRKVGATLGAAYVLEGSVRRAGDKIRVTAQLISARDGMHRWSDTYNGTVRDVFTLQDSIAADLARSLELTVSFEDLPRAMSKPEAYELFLQGKQALDSTSEEGANRAITLLKEALNLEPNSSRTLSTLATAYILLGSEGWGPPNETFTLGTQAAQQALKIDPNNGQAHVALANVAAIYEWNWEKAERELDSALRLGGRDTETLVAGAQILSGEGQYDRAMKLLNEALAKDPLYTDAYMTLGSWIYLRTRQYPEAEQAIRHALQIRPHWGTGQYWLAIALLQQGKLPEALAEAQREKPRDGKYQAMSVVMHAMHRSAQSDDALKQAIAQSQADWPSSIARVYAFRGQTDEALKWLERAYQFRDEDLYFIKDDPLLQKLEADSRYKAFLRKLNLPD
jgi:TolB-like protein/Tfp pilus assembly protein PilF